MMDLQITADRSTSRPILVDQQIDARWIIPVEPADMVLEKYSLVIDGGFIRDLLPTSETAVRYSARRHLKLDQHVLMPGLVNLHTHAAMSLLRGFADDLALMRWLREHIWPAEGRLMSPEFVRDGTELACWEMLRGGTTCFNDMYFFPEAAAEAALSAGMRATLGITVFEFPSAYGRNAADYLEKGMQTRERFRDSPLTSFCLAPHAPYTVADRTFERVGQLAEELDLPVHLHVHETHDEIAASLDEHGVRPLRRLHRLGLLTPRLIAVHAVHLTKDEIDLLESSGSHIAHCPTSNMKLASGIAPIGDMLARGIGVGLGTDGAASNNRLDMFQEMRHAALLAKVAGHAPTLLPAHAALRMATLDGARALGLDDRIGSLRPGKKADLAAIDLGEWILQPCYDPASHLVYVAGREQVSHVWVNGQLRIEDRRLCGVDMQSLLDKVKIWQNDALVVA